MRIVNVAMLIVMWVGFSAAQELPSEWIDPDTGHRVIRLSKEPGSTSLYFHQNGYTPGQARDNYPGKGAMMERRLAERRSMELFTLNIKTGERKTLHKATDWLNHIQFSPTDPNLLMFCHEGPWHEVDRIWIIRTDGSALTKIHKRTMNMEIAGHEFFSGDGKTIWYDLQTPKSQVFWVAGHHTVLPNAPQMIMPGKFKTEKLVNLAKHDYSLEPNVTFSPDMKWVVFRSNMLGSTHVYAVEVEKASSEISTR